MSDGTATPSVFSPNADGTRDTTFNAGGVGADDLGQGPRVDELHDQVGRGFDVPEGHQRRMMRTLRERTQHHQAVEIAQVADRVFDGSCVTVEFPRRTDANDRVLGAELSGAIAREEDAGVGDLLGFGDGDILHVMPCGWMVGFMRLDGDVPPTRVGGE